MDTMQKTAVKKNHSSTYCRMLSIETLVKQCIKANRETVYNRHFIEVDSQEDGEKKYE